MALRVLAAAEDMLECCGDGRIGRRKILLACVNIRGEVYICTKVPSPDRQPIRWRRSQSRSRHH
jgi:hypothetical protein